MKVTAVETIRLGEFPNVLWVQVHTDEGLVGLGETFMGAAAVEAYVHETAGPYLVGRDPLLIDLHARSLYGYIGFRSSGAEMRGNSAIDIALWDLLGQATGRPIHALLGGASRPAIRIYNTCAGYRYIRNRPVQSCGATGRCQASAIAAIFLASERPPTQLRSSMTTSTACCSSRSRKPQRVLKVSLAVTGTPARRLYSPSEARLSILIGSSIQKGS